MCNRTQSSLVVLKNYVNFWYNYINNDTNCDVIISPKLNITKFEDKECYIALDISRSAVVETMIHNLSETVYSYQKYS